MLPLVYIGLSKNGIVMPVQNYTVALSSLSIFVAGRLKMLFSLKFIYTK